MNYMLLVVNHCHSVITQKYLFARSFLGSCLPSISQGDADVYLGMSLIKMVLRQNQQNRVEEE